MPGYDYASPGAYFVTICTHEREVLFGEIVDGQVRLNDTGRIVETEWIATGRLRPNVLLDAFVVMPDHVHGIIWILAGRGHGDTMHRVPTMNPDEASLNAFGAPVAGSLATIIGTFKAAVTRRTRESAGDPDVRIWQGRYHDRVVRDDDELDRIRAYISDNPSSWVEDEENPVTNPFLLRRDAV